MKSIHDFSIKSLDGGTINFADFKGKRIMIVNVASECGYTPQYQLLKEVYNNFKEKCVIVGMPCNDFGGQEPGTEAEIQAFCEKNYHIPFPMTEKVGILHNTHPIYQFLTKKSENGFQDSEVKWNFQKYLLNTEGVLEQVLPSHTNPFDEYLIDWIMFGMVKWGQRY